jgi:hypothetical protein
MVATKPEVGGGASMSINAFQRTLDKLAPLNAAVRLQSAFPFEVRN